MTIPQQPIKPDLPFPISTRLYNFYKHGADRIKTTNTMKIGFFYGFPGSGKSLAAMRALYIINDGVVTQKHIGIKKQEFIVAVLHFNKAGIMADEGLDVMFSRAAMSQKGRESVELFGQMRAQNLFVLVCVHDILLVDKSILKLGAFAIRVYESERVNPTTGEVETIKGNLEIYQHPRKRGQRDRFNQLLRWERINQAGNYLVKNPKPHPNFTEPGQVYNENKPPFYPVDMAEYTARKRSVLDKFDKPQRKPRNTAIDYARMDRAIKLGIPIKDICKLLDVSKTAVMNRKKEGFFRVHKKKRPKRGRSAKKGT